MTAVQSPRPGIFEGFGDGVIEFFEGLTADNTKTYWAAHKPFYDTGVVGPMRLLAAELEPEFGDFKIFRPNRDVRFSNDKSPYKVNVSMAGGAMSGGSLYVELTTEGLLIAGGLYEPARDQLDRFRQLQDEPLVAAELDATLTATTADGYPLGDGDSLKSAPRGWTADHPRIELLRRKRLVISKRYEPGPWLFDAECADVVTDGLRVVQVWNAWLARRVGPPHL